MFYSSFLNVKINTNFMALPYLLHSSIIISYTLSSNGLQNSIKSIYTSVINYNTQVINYIFLEIILRDL